VEKRTIQLQGDMHQVLSLVSRGARVVIGANKNLYRKWQTDGFVLQELIPPVMTTAMKPTLWTHPLDYLPTQTTFIRISWIAAGAGTTEVTVTCEDDQALDWYVELCDVLEAPAGTRDDGGAVNPDSGHFKYSPEKRRAIAAEYRRARDSDEVQNKDGWARTKYSISGKTLLSYEDEFPEKSEA
jgi:hypothetical protein